MAAAACIIPDDVWQLFAEQDDGTGDDDGKVECAAAVDDACVDLSASAAAACCGFCGCADVLLEDGDYFCRGCGSVVSRPIDAGAEWRCYGGEDQRGSNLTRCGLPVNELLPDSSLGSMIGYGGRETHDTRIMRKYHLWNSMNYKERTLYGVFDTLTLSAVNNGIPKTIIEEAKALYKRVTDLKLTRGENKNGLIAASVYLSCKTHSVPRSAKEVAAIFNVKLQIMTRCCKRFQELAHQVVRSTTAEDFIPRFCTKLGMDRAMLEACKQAARHVQQLDMASGNTPPSMAAAIIFMTSVQHGWGLSKKDLAAACEISQVTITKCYKRLLSEMEMH